MPDANDPDVPPSDASAPSEGDDADELVFERDRRLSECMLFEAQRIYFDRVGVRAWSSSTVPHYVTNNPAHAEGVAEVVLGYLRDVSALGPSEEPITLVELGAGSGRFAYLFLRALLALRERTTIAALPLRYVMTDFTESNLGFWRAHPRLRPFVEAGILDFARFDAERPGALALLESGDVLAPGSLARPGIVLANYVFDGISQDAFAIEEERLYESLVTVEGDAPDVAVGSDHTFEHLQLRWSRGAAVSTYYPEPAYDAILQGYARTLGDTTFSFPATALRCVEWLASLSGGRLLLVSSDRGSAHLESLRDQGALELAIHGSFSLSVNHHAFCEWARGRGGAALHAAHEPRALDVIALVLGPGGEPGSETRLGYRRAFENPGIDAFFKLRQGIQDRYASLGFEQLLSVLRLSRHDPRILLDCLPALAERAEPLHEGRRRDLVAAIRRTYDNYFPIGEPRDLPFELGVFAHGLGELELAMEFFEESVRHGARDSHASWNVAVCLFTLGRSAEALARLATIYDEAPGFVPGLGLSLRS